jgi:hypothetical protein
MRETPDNPCHITEAIRASHMSMSPRDVTGKCAVRKCGEAYTEQK